VVAGGVMLNASDPTFLGNAICGRPDLPVIKADESDGTIALYDPAVAVLTNISLDHKPLEELRSLFRGFCSRARQAVVLNRDCRESANVADGSWPLVTFAVEEASADFRATEVEVRRAGSRFTVGKHLFCLQAPGVHNVSNALAASAACHALGVPLADAAEALRGFRGIARRLQVVGDARGVTVIDDFAHNPDKIAASLAALRTHPGRLLVMFQPHGFGPTSFLRDGLVDSFAEGLDDGDLLVMPEIYYAGGTAQRDISSRDIVDAVSARGRRAAYVAEREEVAGLLAAEARDGDRVVVMGARDDTLTDFARSVLDRVGGEPAPA